MLAPPAIAGKKKRPLAVPARLKAARLGFDGVIPSIFRERIFYEDGRLLLRIHALLGTGLLFSKKRVDAMMAGGREKFVELLKKIALRILLEHYGPAPLDQPARSRPTFTKQEQLQRRAEKDATKMVGASAKADTLLKQQRSVKDYQSQNGWFPCMELDDTESCYCERVFARECELDKHSCHFVHAPTGTANLAKQLFHRLMQGDVDP